jgi:hypothetical protein
VWWNFPRARTVSYRHRELAGGGRGQDEADGVWWGHRGWHLGRGRAPAWGSRATAAEHEAGEGGVPAKGKGDLPAARESDVLGRAIAGGY